MKNAASGTWWIENLLRPLVIAVMMACLASPIVGILEWLMPGWDGTYFLVFCFFAALEGIASERALVRQRITGYSYLASRAAEFLFLSLALKLVNYVPLGLDQLWADAQTWPTDPNSFFTTLDGLTILVLLPLWAGALLVGRQTSELDAEEAGLSPPPDKTSTEYYLWMTQPAPVRERQEALDWLAEIFLWGGIGLLLASAVIHILLPATPPPALPILLYFVLGIALLSQARFSVSHAGWQIQGIAIQRGIARRWLFWATLFLVGVALVALVLPTEYTLGPLLTLLYILNIIAQVFLFLITLPPYLLALLLSLLFPARERPPLPPLSLEDLQAAEPQATPTGIPWLETLLSAIFWLVILIIVGYALTRFFRERLLASTEEEGATGSWWARLIAWLRTLWGLWQNWRKGAQEALARQLAQRRGQQPGSGRLPRFLSLRRLSPRDLVRYFYLSAAKRAAQAGQPRRPEQTPYEYRQALDGRFPDLEPDLTGLTEAFIQARYTPRPVAEEDADAVKSLWQRIKAALRQRRASA
jgi:hypothetical protein